MSRYASAFQYCMDILNAVLYYLSYNAIYAFSVCQIFYEKMRTFVNSARLEYINNNCGFLNLCAMYHTQHEPPAKYFIECFDKRYGPMNKTSMHYDPTNYAQEKDLIEECNGQLLLNENSYIIYNAPTVDGLYDKIITDSTFKDVVWANNKIIYKCATYDFMSAQLKFINDPDNVVYNVVLKTNEYNFYIEGNVINRDFILYYSNEILKIGEKLEELMRNLISSDKNALSYAFTIVDADVNVLNITDEHTIILGECTYTCV